MGMFLSMSGVAGISRCDGEEALTAYAEEKSGRFQATEDDFESPGIMAIVEGDDERITVLYPWNFFDWDEASAFLSRRLSAPVFSLHIHDDDLWMYVLFDSGEDVDHFNPIPDYWSDELTDAELAQWGGDASVIARVWPDVSEDTVRNYLVRWGLDGDGPSKAYPDDHYPLNDCFQLIDIMRKLGLEYPLGDRGEVLGESYRFEIPSEE